MGVYVCSARQLPDGLCSEVLFSDGTRAVMPNISELTAIVDEDDDGDWFPPLPSVHHVDAYIRHEPFLEPGD